MKNLYEVTYEYGLNKTTLRPALFKRPVFAKSRVAARIKLAAVLPWGSKIVKVTFVKKVEP